MKEMLTPITVECSSLNLRYGDHIEYVLYGGHGDILRIALYSTALQHPINPKLLHTAFKAVEVMEYSNGVTFIIVLRSALSQAEDVFLRFQKTSKEDSVGYVLYKSGSMDKSLELTI